MVPEGYVLETDGRRSVYMLEEQATALRELGFVAGEPTRSPIRTLQGREPHPVFDLPGTDVRVLWKRCLRGGAMEHLLGDRHLGVARFLEELICSRRAADAGMHVAQAMGLAVVESPTGFKRIEMLSQVIDDASDLEAALTGRASCLRRDWSALIAAVASELRRFHGAGFIHGDLNVKNILFRTDRALPDRDVPDRDVEITFIDLDPGPWRIAGTRISPHQNLMRLFRSVVKGELRGHWHLTHCDYFRFLNEYFRGDRTAMAQFWTLAQRRRASWSRLRFRTRKDVRP